MFGSDAVLILVVVKHLCRESRLEKKDGTLLVPPAKDLPSCSQRNPHLRKTTRLIASGQDRLRPRPHIIYFQHSLATFEIQDSVGVRIGHIG